MDMEKNETEQQKSLKADEENCWLRICLWMIKLEPTEYKAILENAVKENNNNNNPDFRRHRGNEEF